MRISNKTLLSNFVQRNPRAISPLNKWINEVKDADWKHPNDLQKTFPSADFVKNGRFVFNIGGNKFRLVAVIIFLNNTVEIRFIGTHDEYNKINCSEV